MDTQERTVNIPLLRKHVEWVEEQAARLPNRFLPIAKLFEYGRTWLQASWLTTRLDTSDLRFIKDEYFGTLVAGKVLPECGSVGCLAGNVVWDAGYREYAASSIADTVSSFGLVVTENGVRDIPAVARDLLGITPEQGSTLFDASNSAGEIREIAEAIAGERL